MKTLWKATPALSASITLSLLLLGPGPLQAQFSWVTNNGAITIAMGINPLSDGWSYFSDPDWTNYPARFYRLRSP